MGMVASPSRRGIPISPGLPRGVGDRSEHLNSHTLVNQSGASFLLTRAISIVYGTIGVRQEPLGSLICSPGRNRAE